MPRTPIFTSKKLEKLIQKSVRPKGKSIKLGALGK